MKKSIIILLILLMVNFFIILSELLIPGVRAIFKGSFLFLLPIIIFSLLGTTLIIVTIKAKVGGRLRKSLILTGTASSGFFVFVLLHNAFYGLGTITEHIIGLGLLLKSLHVVFFIAAIIVCPFVFIIGIGGSIVFILKNNVSRFSL